MCVQNPGFEFSLDQHLVSKATMYDMIVDPTQKFVATACQDRNIRWDFQVPEFKGTDVIVIIVVMVFLNYVWVLCEPSTHILTVPIQYSWIKSNYEDKCFGTCRLPVSVPIDFCLVIQVVCVWS